MTYKEFREYWQLMDEIDQELLNFVFGLQMEYGKDEVLKWLEQIKRGYNMAGRNGLSCHASFPFLPRYRKCRF